jgi:kumamolisin
MSRRNFALLGLIAAMAITASIVRSARQTGGHAPTAGARPIGALSTGTIRFALNLRLRERRLDAYLTHVNPGTGSTGALTAAQFGARFGQSDVQLAHLHSALTRLGISVAHTYPQRTAMLVRSSVPTVARLFSLRFERYVLPDGSEYFAPDGPPRIPAVLRPYVTSLGDLSNKPILAQDIPETGLTPGVTGSAYDINPLSNSGIRGQGQTIAIASASGAVNPADIQEFARRAGIGAPQIQIVPIDGGSPYDPRAGSDGEVDLDLQVVLGVAPAAHIIDYQGAYGQHGGQLTFGRSLADIYNRIEQDGQTSIVSTSYGLCESVLSPGDQQLMDNALRALEASSVTVFISSGDTGAYGCLRAAQIQPASDLSSQFTALAVLSPASSPYVVSVGGTRLEVRSDGSYLTESAWSDPLERAGGGGGISSSESQPSWQQGPGVPQPQINPNRARQVPDVAGPSDPSSGFAICQTPGGSSGPRCAGGNGGTSAATPFWAASMLLVQQYAAAHGAGALARCFAGPILYDLAAQPQPVPPFHQVTLGNNGFYDAAPGWNFATGLGSPDVFNLAQDYTHFLESQRARTCPF